MLDAAKLNRLLETEKKRCEELLVQKQELERRLQQKEWERRRFEAKVALQEFPSKCARLEEKLKTANQRIAAHEQYTAQMAEVERALRGELDILKQAFELKPVQHEQLLLDAASWKVRARQQEEVVEDQKGKLAGLASRCELLTEKIASSTANEERLEVEYEKVRTNLEALQQQNAQIVSQLEQTILQSKEHVAMVAALTNDRDNILSEKKSLEQKCLLQQKELVALQQHLEDAKSQIEQNRMCWNEAQRLLDEAKKALSVMSPKYDSLVAENESLKRKEHEAARTIELLQSANASLTSRQQIMEKEMALLSQRAAEFDDVFARLSILETSLAEKDSLVKSQQEAIDAAAAQASAHVLQINQVTEINRQQENELKSVKQELYTAKRVFSDRIESIQRQATSEKENATSAQRKLGDAQNEIERLNILLNHHQKLSNVSRNAALSVSEQAKARAEQLKKQAQTPKSQLKVNLNFSDIALSPNTPSPPIIDTSIHTRLEAVANTSDHTLEVAPRK